MIVLDTCVFVWLGIEKTKLSDHAAANIESSRLAISDITFLEVGYLVQKNKLEIQCSTSEFCNLIVAANEIRVIPLTPEIVEAALTLPRGINSDPADRLISATAIISNARLATPDQNLLDADQIPTLW